jgi:hypothetical protein
VNLIAFNDKNNVIKQSNREQQQKKRTNDSYRVRGLYCLLQDTECRNSYNLTRTKTPKR